MQSIKSTTVTVIMSEQDALLLAGAIADAWSGLSEYRWDGCPYNWRADGSTLTKLYNTIKPADWGSL